MVITHLSLTQHHGGWKAILATSYHLPRSCQAPDAMLRVVPVSLASSRGKGCVHSPPSPSSLAEGWSSAGAGGGREREKGRFRLLWNEGPAREDGRKEGKAGSIPLPRSVLCYSVAPGAQHLLGQTEDRPSQGSLGGPVAGVLQSAEGSGQSGADGSQINCFPSRKASGKDSAAARKPAGLPQRSVGEGCGQRDM